MKIKSRAGFSIIELILAIVVTATFVASMTLIVNNYTNLSTRTKNLVLANSYAEGKIESLRNVGFNSLTDGTTSITGELPAGLGSPKSASLTVASPQNGLKQVDVSITYNDLGISRTYNYRSYIGELGVGQ